MAKPRFLLATFLCTALCAFSGCGDPVIHPIRGKVTLDGKAYERLIVYFHPMEGKVNQFNLGVGETDKDGVLSLRSTSGDGLQRGKYRVSFRCVVPVNKKIDPNVGDGKMDDDRRLITKELVPEKYTSETESPVEFEIKAGENVFEFDIPGSN